MVTRLPSSKARQRGSLTTDLVVAMAILVAAGFPLAWSFLDELRSLRATAVRAIAMELVDGEMEILAAGEWRAWPEGGQVYPVKGAAADKLPPGEFRLTRAGQRLRLEWRAADKLGAGQVVREVTVK